LIREQNAFRQNNIKLYLFLRPKLSIATQNSKLLWNMKSWQIFYTRIFSKKKKKKHSILCNVANLLNLAQTDNTVLLQAHQHTDTKQWFHNTKQSNIQRHKHSSYVFASYGNCNAKEITRILPDYFTTKTLPERTKKNPHYKYSFFMGL